MSTPGWDSYHARDRVGPLAGTGGAYAHIEGLCGEEAALLAVPHHERSDEQHARLHALEQELDQVWHRLTARAERRSDAAPPPADT